MPHQDHAPIRSGYRVGAALLAVSLTLALPIPGGSASAEMSVQEEARTCATIYAAISVDAADKNYLEMMHKFYIYSDYSEAAATEEAGRGALRLRTAMGEGRLSEADIIGGAKSCAESFKVPLPLSLSRSVLPSYAATSAAPVRQTVSAPVEPTVSAACEGASSRYASILRSIPGRLAAAGPRMIDMCDDQGRMCGVMNQNSKYYYTLGQICDSVSVAERDIKNSCGADLVPAKLDQC
jgi:hypothetical protein